MTMKEGKACCPTDDLNLPEELRKELESRGGIGGVLEIVPERGYLEYQAQQFHSLSDPIRLQIMYALRIFDMCPCMLKRITDLSDSKLSYHLGKLEGAGLVSSRQNKNWRIYSLTENGRTYMKDRE
jgi:ArsR family transcriptional regulator